jgi:helicase MOV-10
MTETDLQQVSHSLFIPCPHLSFHPQRVFPSNSYPLEPRELPPLRSSVLNRRQQEAVAAVSYLCNRNSASPLPSSLPPPPPYVIYGPPGTGKTITLIEIIRAVYQQNPSVKILACAPSEAAADVLCLRLSKYFTSSQLFRLNWWQRLLASVPIEILNYCHLHEDACFDFPPWENLSRFNIIVSTTVTTGFLRAIPSPVCFDLILIDEVSQATEAETFVPISLCRPSSGVVVLAGDPEQLGPSVRSPAYQLKGMAQSLLEKLLKQKFYDTLRPDTSISDVIQMSSTKPFYFSKFGTFLTSNYRSQKSILSLPSQLFYKNSLRENSNQQSELDSLGSWAELKNAKLTSSDSIDEYDEEEDQGEGEGGGEQRLDKHRPFVVLFQGVDGRHRHEIDSPAFYNVEEIATVVDLCSSLTQSPDLKVTTKDIGVIGAFRSQVLKLRLALRSAHLGGISVGSVEDFQGQEVRIIIISTVLSHRIPSLEMNGSLGLLGDHRKFNVSLTRGMHLAIVVGHPYCLHSDPHWRQLMNYCDQHGTYTGSPCSLLESVQEERLQEDELLNSIARLSLLGMGEGSAAGGVGGRHTNGQYFSDNLEWRGLL